MNVADDFRQRAAPSNFICEERDGNSARSYVGADSAAYHMRGNIFRLPAQSFSLSFKYLCRFSSESPEYASV